MHNPPRIIQALSVVALAGVCGFSIWRFWVAAPPKTFWSVSGLLLTLALVEVMVERIAAQKLSACGRGKLTWIVSGSLVMAVVFIAVLLLVLL